MSGSGSGNFSMNETEMEFNCKNSILSSDNITNRTFWSIGDDVEIGATIVGVIILLFFIVASLWNLFIIITFFIKYHLLKEPANIFLLNVAIIDLLICFTTMVFSFVTAFGKEFVFGSNDKTRCAVCTMSGFFLIFLIFISLHLLMAMSIDRYILLSHPLRYQQLMNKSRAIVICVIVYIICFAIAFLPVVGFGEFEFNSRFAACVPRFTPVENLYYDVFIAFETLIPVTILVITNIRTFRLVRKFLKRNFRRKSTYRRKEEEGSTSEDERKHQKQQQQLVKVFGALIIAYIISYTPTILTLFLFIILSVTGDREDSIPSEVYIFGFLCFLTNPVFHPIIESFFVKELRYQVIRARKGVKRVGSTIYRQTTQLFNSKALEEATEKVDNEKPNLTRTIVFLDGRRVELNDNLLPDHSMPTDHSILTEMEEIHGGNSLHTPSPVISCTTREQELKERRKTTGGEQRQRVMLGNTKRSVTFSKSVGSMELESSDHNISDPGTNLCRDTAQADGFRDGVGKSSSEADIIDQGRSNGNITKMQSVSDSNIIYMYSEV